MNGKRSVNCSSNPNNRGGLKMLKSISPYLFLLKQLVFLLLFFALLRSVFLIYNQQFFYIDKIDTTQVFLVFWNALKVDIATACYILIIPTLLITGELIVESKLWIKITRIFYIVILSVFALIYSGETGLYAEWKTKLSSKIFVALRNPMEVFQTASAMQFFSFLGLAILLAFGGYFILNRYFLGRTPLVDLRNWQKGLFFSITVALLALGLRGGFNAIPISTSAAYFSKHSFLNHAALNSGYNLAVSIFETRKFNYENPFIKLPAEEAQATTQQLLMPAKDTTEHILTTNRPNVVILLLESWSADLIESLGGEPGITPQFHELEKEGILFTELYSTGSRSHQAMAAIIGGFPATPYSTITENADKFSKLPSLNKIFKEHGYHTSFYFGGELNYGNIRAYLLHNDFDRIIEGKNFNGDFPRGRLGVHDEALFQRHLAEMDEQTQPFFSMLFTLSSHAPYDQPMEKVLDWGGNENEFINSAYYTDLHLGNYFREARNKKWFNNTLFIIMADHSHNTYRNWPLENFNYHKIPLLILGPVVKEQYRNTRKNQICANNDLPKTILNQLGWPSDSFTWSKDLFNPYSTELAYFELHYAFGFKRPAGAFVYSWDWDHFYQFDIDSTLNEDEQEKLIREGRAYLQTLFQEFIDM